jgi:hypothetical protein
MKEKPAIILLLAAAMLLPPTASAESKATMKYPYGWVFASAVRLIRVDLKCDIVEESEKSGVSLFWYEYNGVKSYATIEIVDLTSEDNGYSVFVRVTLEKLPSWVEEDLIDKLAEKLKEQYGNPPVYKKKKKEKDEGGEGEKKKDEDKDKDQENQPS